MNTKSFLAALCLVPLVALGAQEGQDRGAQIGALDWHTGPKTEAIAGKATLNTPDSDTLFIDAANTKKFLQLTGNIPSDGNFVVLNKKGNWWAAFSFSPMGYVKDDEKIDADAILKTIQGGDAAGNEERKRLGLPALYTDGWYIPPHYDPQTKRLEWGVKLRSEGHTNLNYTIRLLGRTGVMNATLVSSPETLDADVTAFKATLAGFDFNAGERYSEFKQGDRVAEYGLAALIAGGAAAVATKKGFWAVIGGFLAATWKLVVAGVIALGAGLRSLISKRKES